MAAVRFQAPFRCIEMQIVLDPFGGRPSNVIQGKLLLKKGDQMYI